MSSGPGGFSFPPPPPPPPPHQQQHQPSSSHQSRNQNARYPYGGPQQQGYRARGGGGGGGGGSQRGRNSNQRRGGKFHNNNNNTGTSNGSHDEGRFSSSEYANSPYQDQNGQSRGHESQQHAPYGYMSYPQAPPASYDNNPYPPASHHHSHPVADHVRVSSPLYPYPAAPSPSSLSQQPAYLAQHQPPPPAPPITTTAAYVQPGHSAGRYAPPAHFLSQPQLPPYVQSQPPPSYSHPHQQHQHHQQQQPQIPAHLMGPPIHWTPEHASTSPYMPAAMPVGGGADTVATPGANGVPYNGRPSDSRGRYRPNRGRGRGGYDHGNPHGHNKPMSANVAANHGNKRSHANAFQPHAQQQSAPSHPSTATALPVPSFGLPLPSRPPIAAGASKKNKKKKRKHNQLGLTPRSHDHESSSSEGDNDDDEDEEHDADEESKLTKNLAAAAPLQFSYKGRTAKLQSAADIQAWIEERKKKFPTKARIEEKMKEAEQKKAKVDEAKRVKQEENKERREKFKAEKAQATDPADAAAKAKLKAEKLRRKLLKEEAKVAKAEADAERANKLLQQNEVKAVEKSDDTADKAGVQVSGDVPLPATGPQVSALDQKADSNVEREKSPSSTLLDKVEAALSGAAVQDDGDADINAKDTDTTSLPSQLEQEVLAVDEDWTSSSGSDTSSSSLLDDSDGDSNIAAKIEVDASTEIIDAADGVIESIGQGNDEDSDSAPDQSTSKRAGPERVLPPARKADAQQPAQEGKKGKSKQICNQFLKFGRCQRGQACKFLHERQVKANGATSGSASQRKSLFQILLEKEKENEDSRIMDAIIYLGQHGILDAPAATAPTEETEAGRTE